MSRLIEGLGINHLIAGETDVTSRTGVNRQFGHKGQRQRVERKRKALPSQIGHADAPLRGDDGLQPLPDAWRHLAPQQVHQGHSVDDALTLHIHLAADVAKIDAIQRQRSLDRGQYRRGAHRRGLVLGPAGRRAAHGWTDWRGAGGERDVGGVPLDRNRHGGRRSEHLDGIVTRRPHHLVVGDGGGATGRGDTAAQAGR
ncbi:hypothetical protein D3C85_611370 [compost metagenome]